MSKSLEKRNITNINVGILGHVDSGKTSLVKALSTSLSTAALDKNPQSQQRGITLDLGFSAFSLPMPEHLQRDSQRLHENQESLEPVEDETMQFTLVDCPGHASLIKTIIGGAQIIDMIVLVIDANKGIQTQTAECIVIGEITTNSLVVVLNKIDMIPIEEREEKLVKIMSRIRLALSTTKFKDSPIVCTAAAVGGEKVAATTTLQTVTKKDTALESSTSSECLEKNIGIEPLVALLCNSVKFPKRKLDAPFYFSIDHCFPIKGHGTVITGTVLSGTVAVNQMIELPYIQQQRKIKSMQMFKKSVKNAKQGDRLGMCVTNLDASTIERGIAVEPNSVPLLRSVVCLVKKIRFFRGICRSNTKYHVSIGHTTVIANITFFGASELRERSLKAEIDTPIGTSFVGESQTLSASYQDGFPPFTFDWSKEYVAQDALVAEKNGEVHDGAAASSYGNEAVQWAHIQFMTPVFCPLHSLIIGSRLDTDIREDMSTSKHCRLAFFGPVIEGLTEGDEKNDLKIYSSKVKQADIFKLTDVRSGGICYELIAHNLFGEGGSLTPFIGLRMKTTRGQVGTITSSYGSGGKFKIKFVKGIPRSNVAIGSKLYLYFKRFYGDKTKAMKQSGDDVENGIPSHGFQESTNINNTVTTTEFDKIKMVEELLPKQQVTKNNEKTIKKSEPIVVKKIIKMDTIRLGVVETMKEFFEDNGKKLFRVAIISGAFKLEENIRNCVGSQVTGPNGEIGEVIGPFAKTGKCKVSFDQGCEAESGSVVQVSVQEKE